MQCSVVSGEKVLSEEMYISWPAHNLVRREDEDTPVDIMFISRNPAFLDSLKLHLDGESIGFTIGGLPLDFKYGINIRQYFQAGELAIGKHTIGVEFQDRPGKLISYAWNFYIVPENYTD